MTLLNWSMLRPRWLATREPLFSDEDVKLLDIGVASYDYSARQPALTALMTDMPGPNETRLNLIDGVEYFTVRADDFRDAMRIRDELQAERARLRRFQNEVFEVYGGNYEPKGRLADLSEVIERALKGA